MHTLRTHDARFLDLPGYAYTPHYVQALRKLIRGCPAPCEHAEAGHFAQEWGEDIALRAFA
jgi:hypothetical protein